MRRGLLFAISIAKFILEKMFLPFRHSATAEDIMENKRSKLVENWSYNINVKSIKEEIEHCAEVFGLNPDATHEYADEMIIGRESEVMEGIFAIPSTPHPPEGENVSSIDSEYNLACTFIKLMLSRKYSLDNYIQSRDDNGRPRVWQLHPETMRAKLLTGHRQQGQKIVLIAAQLGREYVNCSNEDTFKKCSEADVENFHWISIPFAQSFCSTQSEWKIMTTLE